MIYNNPLVTSLKEVCVFLDESAIEYMLVGGLAVGIWAEPRATVNIDFLVATSLGDSDRLKQKLAESDRFVFIHDKPMVFGKVSFLRAMLRSDIDVSVDFIFVDDEFKYEALKRKETAKLTDFSINIATPEDLIILKLLSNREQDGLDARKILEIQRENLDMEYLQTWSEKLGIKIESFIK